jgi:hypothetical protein
MKIYQARASDYDSEYKGNLYRKLDYVVLEENNRSTVVEELESNDIDFSWTGESWKLIVLHNIVDLWRWDHKYKHDEEGNTIELVDIGKEKLSIEESDAELMFGGEFIIEDDNDCPTATEKVAVLIPMDQFSEDYELYKDIL